MSSATAYYGSRSMPHFQSETAPSRSSVSCRNAPSLKQYSAQFLPLPPLTLTVTGNNVAVGFVFHTFFIAIRPCGLNRLCIQIVEQLHFAVIIRLIRKRKATFRDVPEGLPRCVDGPSLTNRWQRRKIVGISRRPTPGPHLAAPQIPRAMTAVGKKRFRSSEPDAGCRMPIKGVFQALSGTRFP